MNSGATVSTTSLSLKLSTSEQVRNRFLNMIGIESKLPKCPLMKPTLHSGCSQSSLCGLSNDPVSVEETETSTLSSSSSSLSVNDTSGRMEQHQQIASVVDETAHNYVHPRTKVALYAECLKYDKLADKLHAPKRRKMNDKEHQENIRPLTSRIPNRKSSEKKKRIVFNESVKVVPIPMRTEYSNRVKSRLWSNALEIHENATRNALEFAFEGWDWRKVTEDERMYVCVATGELIHPCHYDSNFTPDAL